MPNGCCDLLIEPFLVPSTSPRRHRRPSAAPRTPLAPPPAVERNPENPATRATAATPPATPPARGGTARPRPKAGRAPSAAAPRYGRRHRRADEVTPWTADS